MLLLVKIVAEQVSPSFLPNPLLLFRMERSCRNLIYRFIAFGCPSSCLEKSNPVIFTQARLFFCPKFGNETLDRIVKWVDLTILMVDSVLSLLIRLTNDWIMFFFGPYSGTGNIHLVSHNCNLDDSWSLACWFSSIWLLFTRLYSPLTFALAPASGNPRASRTGTQGPEQLDLSAKLEVATSRIWYVQTGFGIDCTAQTSSDVRWDFALQSHPGQIDNHHGTGRTICTIDCWGEELQPHRWSLW